MAKRRKRKSVRKKIIWIIILCILICIAGGFYIYILREQKLKKSFDDLYPLSLLTLCDEPVTIESGEELTFNNNEVSSLKGVPDQLKSCILGFNNKASVVASDFDNVMTGVKEVILKTSVSDEYGQTRDSYQPMYVNVIDTKEPEVRLQYGTVTIIDNFGDIDNNVVGVIDEVYGDYSYSENGENHTWYVDKSSIKYTRHDYYPAWVVINDNGNIVRKEFEVEIIPKD